MFIQYTDISVRCQAANSPAVILSWKNAFGLGCVADTDPCATQGMLVGRRVQVRSELPLNFELSWGTAALAGVQEQSVQNPPFRPDPRN